MKRVLRVETDEEKGDRFSTQLAKMNIDPKFVELTAGVVRTIT